MVIALGVSCRSKHHWFVPRRRLIDALTDSKSTRTTWRLRRSMIKFQSYINSYLYPLSLFTQYTQSKLCLS